MGRVLIIKSFSNNFESLFSKHMTKENVRVVEPYKKFNHFFLKCINLIAKKTGMAWLTSIVLGDWKKEIKNYERIIVFDKETNYTIFKCLKKKNHKVVLISWLWNIPSYSISPIVRHADIVTCFDKQFSVKNDLTYVHQFYFPEFVNHNYSKQTKYDLLFIGTAKGRESELLSIETALKKNNLSFKCIVVGSEAEFGKDSSIEKSNALLDYTEVIKLVCESRCILELVKEGQTGLTLRALEGLYFHKKILTNNPYIYDYDCFDSNNVFMIKDEFKKFSDFLTKDHPNYCNPLPYDYLDWIKKMKALEIHTITSEE